MTITITGGISASGCIFGPPPPVYWYGTRGVATNVNTLAQMYYYNISAATGTSTLFGSLSQTRQGLGGGSIGAYGVFACGSGSGLENLTRIDQITIGTPSNGTNIGDCAVGIQSCSGASDGTYVYKIGGVHFSPVYWVGTIERITPVVNSVATMSGGLNTARNAHTSVANSTRVITAGGAGGSGRLSSIEYFNPNGLTATSASFGGLSTARDNIAGVADSTRALFMGGYDTTQRNYIQYVTINSTSDATNFGNLTGTYATTYGMTDGTKAIMLTVSTGADYITNIQSLSNASSWSGLTAAIATSTGWAVSGN